MKDFALSDNEAVQRQLDRLGALSLPQGRFGLETIRELLARLGDPQDHLPPVFHVAGTNGKGSTCAFLRAMLEAAGFTVHAATKPHLVRYNERIRVAGQLIADDLLASLLEEVLDTAGDLAPSFYEVTTAATFLAFARHPADAVVLEVGLGGRFDATNVLAHPAACGIASLGVDHEAFLLTEDPSAPSPTDDPLVRIAFEKAGIARPGSPLVTQAYPAAVTRTIIELAMQVGAKTAIRDCDWFADVAGSIAYRDRRGVLDLPLPSLPGAHQADNAALAVAMLRHQSALEVSAEAMAHGITAARWPARLQELAAGPLTELAHGRQVLLDGGHNPDAAKVLARHLAGIEGPVHALVGMMAAKDARRFLGIIAPHLASVTAVPIAGSDHVPLDVLAALARDAGVADVREASDLPQALEALPTGSEGTVLIAGSLYLAGKALAANREWPD